MTSSGAVNARKPRPLNHSKRIIGILFLLPSVILILFSNAVPFLWNLILSFQKWDGFGDPQWVGWSNFSRVIADKNFYNATLNSLSLGILSSILTVVLGVLLAFALFRFSVREGGTYRLVLFLPYLLPMSVIGLMFSFMLNFQYGPLNQLLRLIGLESWAKAWLSDPATVMPVLVFVRGWKTLGMTMLLCVAAIQAIPGSLFESAYLDGATTMKIYRKIVLPLIMPVIALSLLNTLMSSFKSYDIVKIMTNGGPGRMSYVVPMVMMDQAFSYKNFGFSAAMGSVFTAVVMVVIVIANRLMRSEAYEY